MAWGSPAFSEMDPALPSLPGDKVAAAAETEENPVYLPPENLLANGPPERLQRGPDRPEGRMEHSLPVLFPPFRIQIHAIWTT